MADNGDAAVGEREAGGSRGTPLVIHGALRSGLAALGVALILVAVWGVLTTDNELGTVAMALVGAAFITVGAIGRWPSRLVWGDKSAEFYGVALEELAASGTPETKQEVLDAMDRSARSLGAGRGDAALLAMQERLHRHWATTLNRDEIEWLTRCMPPQASLIADDGGSRIVIAPSYGADKARCVAVVPPTRAAAAAMGTLLSSAFSRKEEGYGAVLLLHGFGVRLLDLRTLTPEPWLFEAVITDPHSTTQATISAALAYAEEHAQ